MGGGVGKDGKSAYEIALDKGFEGSEEEWLNSLKGISGFSYKDIDYTNPSTIEEYSTIPGDNPGITFTSPIDGLALVRLQNSSGSGSHCVWIVDKTYNKAISGTYLISNQVSWTDIHVVKNHVYDFMTNASVSMKVVSIVIYPYKQNNLYSTEEQVIGTWIDGKPIYRSVFETTTPSNIDTPTDILDCSNLNIDHLIKLDGFIKINVGTGINQVPLNWSHENNPIRTHINLNNTVRMRVGTQNQCNMICHIVLEYTKTSD